VTGETRRELARLPPDDPLRPVVEFALSDPDPAVTAAVVSKLLQEINAEIGRAGNQMEPNAHGTRTH
jgi:hypothetical protein